MPSSDLGDKTDMAGMGDIVGGLDDELLIGGLAYADFDGGGGGGRASSMDGPGVRLNGLLLTCSSVSSLSRPPDCRRL
jgi:hypothetical protein